MRKRGNLESQLNLVNFLIVRGMNDREKTFKQDSTITSTTFQYYNFLIHPFN